MRDIASVSHPGFKINPEIRQKIKELVKRKERSQTASKAPLLALSNFSTFQLLRPRKGTNPAN